MPFHKNLSTDQIHVIYDQTYADDTARDADTAWNGLSANIGKAVFVSADDTTFMLLSVTPTWFEFGGAVATPDTIYNADSSVQASRTVTIPWNRTLHLEGYSSTGATFTTGAMLDVGNGSVDIEAKIGDGVGGTDAISRVLVNTEQMQVLDQINSTGLQYAADYSSMGSTNDRWLPDKGWIETWAYANSNNTLFGTDALASIEAGPKLNTAIGYQVLTSTTTGANNVGLGYQSMFNNIIGEKNTGLGYKTLHNNSEGNWNTAVGYNVLHTGTNASSNVGVGNDSMWGLTTGYENVGVGNSTLQNIANGYSNSALGYRSGLYFGLGTDSNVDSIQSVYLGSDARASISGSTNEIVIGYNTLGQGSNTATLGNDNITTTYLKGIVNVNKAVFQAGRSFSGSTDTAILNMVGTYFCSNTSSAITLTISSADIALATALNPWNFEVLDVSGYAGTTHNIVINTEGSEKINGVDSIEIGVSNGSAVFTCDGSNLYIRSSS